MRPVEISGHRYGRLTVIERVGSSDTGKSLWRCVCECGNEVRTTAGNLRSQIATSCGCSRSGARIENRREALEKYIYQRFLRGTAIQRGIDWNLTFSEALSLSRQPCFYCGCDPIGIVKDERYRKGKIVKTSDTVIRWNGLDRIDSKGGYSPDNVVPCCRHCNVAKSDRTIEEFMEWSKNLYGNLFNGGQRQLYLSR